PAGWVAYGHYNTGEVFIFDMNTGAFIDSFDAGSRIRDIAFDAAGNLYTVDNLTEWLRIWSPAGANSFTTESWFEIVPEPASVLALGAGLVSLLGLRRRKA
ncbi:MAG: PEP-CTERM sorting domain-containing protein, partial [Armatimonadota bacterium]